jgi:hypothetical protein
MSSAEFVHRRTMAGFATGAMQPAKSLLSAALLQHRPRSPNQKNDIFIGLGIHRKADSDDRWRSSTNVHSPASYLNFGLPGRGPVTPVVRRTFGLSS